MMMTMMYRVMLAAYAPEGATKALMIVLNVRFVFPSGPISGRHSRFVFDRIVPSLFDTALLFSRLLFYQLQ